ncbi:YbaB/EbfC family nucleoid-associated protein [Amycolatopsis sp. H20-H5]|uniref:YbaB/EbfC family nucleoid-associated protein n=1 Tax=Amycolatopsis sp. H20-H5 TaxID=3046309 RepID=UPI002DBC3395|nr:YbaB/EbfC family nucleoid-associated protein [Amycolatopsis sp. H20-H5]MEC3980854.1 YbaB/EbfC family nucleoid-associated protein [Amycolatopsis sp. H20-H5]
MRDGLAVEAPGMSLRKMEVGMSLNVAKLQQQAVELDTELAAARYSAQSADKIATATVSGQGTLLTLVIADHAIRGSHPHLVGPAVLDAVSAARRQASAVSLSKLRAVLDKDQEWRPEPPPIPAGEPAVSPARRRAVVEDHDSFDELDFVTDAGDPDDADRGRW